MPSKIEDAACALNDDLNSHALSDASLDPQYLGELRPGDAFAVKGVVVRRRDDGWNVSVDVALLGQDYDLPECVTLSGHLLVERATR